MISLPLWALFTIGFGSPVSAFVGVLLAQAIARRGATDLETRSRREETMRNLRWAAELSARQDERLADLGISQLEALLNSDLLEASEKIFVEAALDAVYEDPELELDDLGMDAEAVRYVVEGGIGITADGAVEVSSEAEAHNGGEDHD